MDLKKYQQPITDICVLSTCVPVMIGQDLDQITSQQFTNGHRWEEERLGEGLDDSPYAHTAPSLWDE